MMDERTLALHAAQALYDKKAVDLTGRTAQQVHSLCDDVEDKLLEDGVSPRKKEGQNDGRWAILDYGPVLVHIFHPEQRQYYKLERLWDEGTNRVELPFAQNEETKAFMP